MAGTKKARTGFGAGGDIEFSHIPYDRAECVVKNFFLYPYEKGKLSNE